MTTMTQAPAPDVSDDDWPDFVTVPMEVLLEWGHPLEDPPWGCAPISVQDVQQAVSNGGAPDDHEHDDLGYGTCCWGCEVERIAHFVALGVDPQDPHPISFDGGLGERAPQWPIVDGNHRLAALVVLGATEAHVALCGDVDRAREMLR